MPGPLVWPLAAMVLLTLLVWLRLYQTRIGEMKRRRIHPQSVATSAQMAAGVSSGRSRTAVAIQGTYGLNRGRGAA